MIKINKIEPQLVELFAPDDSPLGFINEYEFNDIRVQIAQQKASGYYILFNNKKIIIEPTGRLHDWPNGMFDLQCKQFAEIFKANK